MSRESPAGGGPGLGSALLFGLERFLARGPHTRIAALWSLVLLLALAGGLLAWWLPAGEFAAPWDAVWWAFLRLSDSGYLEEDQAPGLRGLAIVLTVLGLALFVGGLVAVLTQWFNERMERFTLGLTPVTFRHHVVVLGWTNRTLTLVEALLRGSPEPPRIVILIRRITPEVEQRLADRLGRGRSRVVLRTGDPEHPEHLARALGRGAAVVVLPGDDQPGRDARDEDPRALKILASLEHAAAPFAQRPRALAEIADPRRVPLAHRAYPERLVAVPTEVLVGRSLALGILSAGLCTLFVDLLDVRDGSSLRVERHPGLAGDTLASASGRFARAVLLGIVRGSDGGETLDVDGGARLREDDRLLLLAPVRERVEAEASGAAEAVPDATPVRPEPARARRQVLLLGWSGKVPDLCWELGRQHEMCCRIDVVSTVDIAAREALLGLEAEAIGLRHLVGDPTSPDVFDALDLQTYDCVVLVGGDGATYPAEADSRTIAATLLLRHLLAGSRRRPHVIAELLDAANAPILAGAGVELLITPDLMAGMLAGAVLHPELEGLFELLLRGRVGRLGVVPLAEVFGEGQETAFGRVEARLRASGIVCLGLQREATGHALELATDKRAPIRVHARDRVVVVRPIARALGADPSPPSGDVWTAEPLPR